MAKALASDDIFVYTIAPGFVETDMAKLALEQARGESIRNQSPLGRVAEPIEIAETIAFLATGKKLKEIAAELCLSINTISTYRSRILQKMDLKSNADVIHYAINNKLIRILIPNFYI